jgi:anti-anti-sigma factor
MNETDVFINQIKNDDGSAVITLSGNLTISNSEKIQHSLIEAFKLSINISIEINEIENIDLSFIQLIYSLSKESKNFGKNINITSKLNEDMRLLIENAGFSKLLNSQNN